MTRWVTLLCVLAAALALAGTATGGSRVNGLGLQMYTAKVSRATAARIVSEGYDVTRIRTLKHGTRLDLVLTRAERAKLRHEGVRVTLKRDRQGRTVVQRAALQAQGGFNVWRSWDEPGGIRDELYQIAAANPDIVKLEVIGHSVQGREIIALKLTKDAQSVTDGSRPAVLYNSLQHAREWISVEVNRLTLLRFIKMYREAQPLYTRLVSTRELWFVLVANPDGYQYTFDTERLWRKNLRDNDADGHITTVDGVDPNRNWPEHWNYDEEGSSSLTSSETYRGTAANSEPETQALVGLLNSPGQNPLGKRFAFMVNYHSYGPLLLSTFGWQVQTPSADDPVFVALQGTDKQPAIAGFDPGVGADLYVTNGETTDFAHAVAGTLAWTPELEEGCAGCGFVFPDNQGKVDAEFKKALPFIIDVADSAADPARPKSHLGNSTQPFYLNVAQFDPEKSDNPMSDFRFSVSYGDPQPAQVLARRDLGAVALKYQINGGAVQSAVTSEWSGGQRYAGPGDLYYHIVRGNVTGTSVGDTVKVWFAAGELTSESFTYKAAVESTHRVLILAAEDYSGISTAPPGYPAGPRPYYLSYYGDALTANGIGYDVYDVDARGRIAPDHLGVLGHYDAVIWYTGNDAITREPYQSPGNASRLANDEVLEVRAYLNEGGHLLYTGKYAGHEYTLGHGTQVFDPEKNGDCAKSVVASHCDPLSDDFLQYYLGAYLLNENAGTNGSTLFDVLGTDTPFPAPLSWSFDGAGSAQNQNHSASFLPTSAFLPASSYPQFASWRSAKYDRPGGPFEPHTGTYYMYSQMADVSYKRLTRTITVPAAGATMSFWVSRDTEPDWDYLFVEAHAVGSDDWTTLADQNGHSGTSTGESCPAGWRELHPWLDRYQGADCSGVGTTGTWNAASGNSNGWEQWQVNLDAYAGQDVEISIAYASDWATQGLGVFVDDIVVSTGEGTTSFETDADVMDGWAVTGPAEGSAPNANNFERITAAGFPEGAVIATAPPDATYKTLYFGFGFEGISNASTRNAVMNNAMDYLCGC